MTATSIEQSRFEPTVFGAVRRYLLMVLVIALLTAAAAAAYSYVVPKVYRATATATVPPTSLEQGEASEQYLDSQVLLLQSQEVAQRAAVIANASLSANVLSPQNFSADEKRLNIMPPEGADSGSYGSSIVSVSFTWPDAKVAQVGANAVLQAFDDARVAAITAQAEALVDGIEKAMGDARTRGQLTDLGNQRAETLVNQQVDLARHPTVMWAAQPLGPINANLVKNGAIGLLVGLILGGAVAYIRAIRRRCLEDRTDPLAIYHAPLLGEIPAPRKGNRSSHSETRFDPLLPVVTDPESAPAEAFRFAAGSVARFHAARGNPLVVALVGTKRSATKSSVVANLALAIAEGGVTVLAVDADSSEAGLTALLLPGSAPAEGFEQVLTGQWSVSDCTHPSTSSENLQVLPAGAVEAKRTTGTAYARAVEEMVGKAKASFDLVLIDSPPLLQNADAAEIMDNSDAAIVVIGLHETVRDHITMVERLKPLGCEVIGYTFQSGGSSPFARPLAMRRRRSAVRASSADLQVAPSWW